VDFWVFKTFGFLWFSKKPKKNQFYANYGFYGVFLHKSFFRYFTLILGERTFMELPLLSLYIIYMYLNIMYVEKTQNKTSNISAFQGFRGCIIQTLKRFKYR